MHAYLPGREGGVQGRVTVAHIQCGYTEPIKGKGL